VVFELAEKTVFVVFAVTKSSSSLSSNGKRERIVAGIRESDAISSNVSLLRVQRDISGTTLLSATLGLTVRVILKPKKFYYAIRSKSVYKSHTETALFHLTRCSVSSFATICTSDLLTKGVKFKKQSVQDEEPVWEKEFRLRFW
jgi:hypothetical protein